MKVVAIVQARMGSTRLPNKVMMPIGNIPMIGVLLKRLSFSKQIDEIVLATSHDKKNDVMVSYVQSLGFGCKRGSEFDVLGRFLDTAATYSADIIVRITGDCPLVDAALVDEAIRLFKNSDVEYLSNVAPPMYPDGLDIEVFSYSALITAAEKSSSLLDREHVTPYLRTSGVFKTGSMPAEQDYSSFRWTVDELVDFNLIEAIVTHFHPSLDFSWIDVLNLSKQKPHLFKSNNHLLRNEGATMSSGQKLWTRAKKVIPGGTMLLSKRPDMFLPEGWPCYYSKSKGCEVWDLDKNKFTDMSIMGIGTNILGYCHPEIDEAVIKTVGAGNMSTLNCPEEVELSERLVAIHPWADMVRLARSGGEANAIAIRIARAFTGKDKVAVCGYHGWHDWYLSANLSDKEGLDGHLLPGLDPLGVPRNLQNSVLPFNYNDIDSLELLLKTHDIGVIKMEVTRNMGPSEGFLETIRQICNEKGIVLIFDECTSGFRETFGGIHKKYDVEPDMAMFGKALGNGYAITAVIGKRNVMDAAQNTFISSTFWTERIGPTAALKTLEVMEREKSWESITAIGSDIISRWKLLAERKDLAINCSGIPALASFSFESPNALAYKTLITQELLANGFLAGTSIYVSTAHTEEKIAEYFFHLDKVFDLIRDCESGLDVLSLLNGPVCNSGFKRLN